MAKAELKTKKNKQSITAFVNAQDTQQKKDSKAIIKMMREATGAKPVMWGDSIIGFGNKCLKYASGRELDWFLIGFSPRKGKISLYCMCRNKRFNQLLKKLGKHKSGKGCLYIKTLDDIDHEVLAKMFQVSVNAMKNSGEGTW